MENENTLLKVSEIKTGIEVLQSKKTEYLELVEKSKDLKIDGVTDKENYELVRNHWKTLQQERISVEKQAKELRAAVKPVQEMISSGEKELLSILCPEEDRLYKEWKAVDEEKQRAKEEAERLQREKIAKRKAQLLDMGMIFDGLIYRFPGDHSDEFHSTTDQAIEEALDEDFELILEKFQEKADAIAFAAEMEAKRKADEEERMRKEREELEAQKKAAEEAAAALKKQQEEQAAEIERQRQEVERVKIQLELEKRKVEEETRRALEAAKKAKEEIRMRRMVAIGFNYDSDFFFFQNRAGRFSATKADVFETEDFNFEGLINIYVSKVSELKASEDEIIAKEKAEIEEKARREAEAAAERKRIAEEQEKAAKEAARIAAEEEEKRKAAEKEAMKPESEKLLDMLQRVYDAASLPTGSVKTEKMAGIYLFYRTKLQALNAEVKQKLSEHE